MNSEERLFRVLQHEAVDRVPFFEWAIDHQVIHALCPGLTQDEFVYKADMDAVCVDPDYRKMAADPGIVYDEWGIRKDFNTREYENPVLYPVQTRRDLSRYTLPKANVPHRFETLEKKLLQHRGRKAVILHLNDVLSIPFRIAGVQRLFAACCDEPSFAAELLDLAVYMNLELAKEAAKRGVKIICTGDAYCCGRGLPFPPEHFEKLFYPGLCKMVKGFKDLGLLVIKRTNGSSMPVIERIVASGIDCLDPVDPLAGMDISIIKKRFGSRVTVKGNIDCTRLLVSGTTHDVMAETRRCLRAGAPGGGYIFSSNNCIHSGVKPENFAAMIETHRKYGGYPDYQYEDVQSLVSGGKL